MKPVILFDGVCNFCNYWVNFIIRNDKKKVFLFAPLQSEAGKKIRERINSIINEKETDSVILVSEENYFLQSDAILQIAKILNGKWLLIFILLKITPKLLRDFFYKFIATNRYKWFGKKDVCMIPEEKIKERFLS